MNPIAPNKSVSSGNNKGLMIGMTLMISVIAAIVLWYKTINTLPAVTIPAPTFPAHNAFASFLAASNAVVDSKKIGFAIAKDHTSPVANPDDRDYSLAEKQALVAENTEPLRTLRTGFAYPYLNPPARSINDLFPYYAKFRGMARLLALEGQVKTGQGDWNGAVNADLDAIQMGEMIPHGSILIGDLVGIACQAIGRRPIWNDVEHLNAAQSEAAVRRLEKMQTLHVPFANVLQEEKWAWASSLLEFFKKPNWRAHLKDFFGDDTNKTYLRMQQAHMYFISEQTIMDNYTQYMDKSIANAHQPYTKHAEIPEPSDPMSQLLIPVFAGARVKDIEGSVVQNTLLTVTLALHAYRLDHGAYPPTLSALVPRYLGHIPDDPFATSGPLHYKVSGATYLIYSIGPDGIDDGGNPVFDRTKPLPSSGRSDPRYFINADSKGDVVAGININ